MVQRHQVCPCPAALAVFTLTGLTPKKLCTSLAAAATGTCQAHLAQTKMFHGKAPLERWKDVERFSGKGWKAEGKKETERNGKEWKGMERDGKGLQNSKIPHPQQTDLHLGS